MWIFNFEEKAIERLYAFIQIHDSKRTFIFRDVLNQMVSYYKNDGTKKSGIEEFYALMATAVGFMYMNEIIEVFNKYINFRLITDEERDNTMEY